MIRPARAIGFAVEALVTLAAIAVAVWAVRADPPWFGRHVLADYCVAAHPIWPWQLARVCAGALAVALAVWVRPRLGRVAPLDLLAVVPAIVLGLGAGELILRQILWDDNHEGGGRPANLVDPQLGWVPAPSQTIGAYAINRHGERVARVDDDGDPAAPTLIVTGESIAFGWKLAWDDTFAARAGRALGLRVVDVGVASYASDQAYLRLVAALARLQRPALVVFVFVAQEIRRNLSPARPHLVLDGGALVPVPAATGLAAWRLARLLTDEPYHGPAALAVTRAILVAAADAARARGARPLFLVTNYGPACPAEDDEVGRELFAGLPVVRVTLGPDDVIGGGDPHPNARGAAKIADAIVKAR